MRHHFDFGTDRAVVGDELVRPEAWDALRTRIAGAFALARSPEELERVAKARPELLRPERDLVLADYAPETVERLRKLFPGTEVHRRDLRADPPLDADAHLLHRVDTELADAEWHDTLQRFARETLLVVATEVATPRRLANELLTRIRRRHLTRAGWLRTRDAFEALWRDTHDARPLRLHDLEGWALTPRRP